MWDTHILCSELVFMRMSAYGRKQTLRLSLNHRSITSAWEKKADIRRPNPCGIVSIMGVGSNCADKVNPPKDGSARGQVFASSGLSRTTLSKDAKTAGVLKP